jgi:hypothetical protein
MTASSFPLPVVLSNFQRRAGSGELKLEADFEAGLYANCAVDSTAATY